jgi:hypothetical protein
MINGSVVAPAEVMSERDSMNAFIDGAAKAISAAKELAKATKNPEWINVAETLEAMRIGCRKLFDMKSMSRFETLMAASLKANPRGFLN